MGGLAHGAMRDANGRFIPGQSGNPGGKKPGTRNRATVLREALRDGEEIAAARIVIDKALAGDAVAARFIVDRLTPRPRGRTIALDLPAAAGARDIVAAHDATLRAMASGEITPDEALQVSRVLDGRLRALKMAAREHRLDKRSNSAKPSLLGRGVGEGGARTADGADTASSRGPHPVPLRHGEAMASARRVPLESPAFRLHFADHGGGTIVGASPNAPYWAQSSPGGAP